MRRCTWEEAADFGTRFARELNVSDSYCGGLSPSWSSAVCGYTEDSLGGKILTCVVFSIMRKLIVGVAFFYQASEFSETCRKFEASSLSWF